MATVLDFYFDTFSRGAVSGPSSSSPVTLAHFVQGDTYSFRVRALNRTANFVVNAQYDLVQNAGKTMQLAISKADGTTILTQQYTWLLNADPADPYFYADVAFNTAPINTALTTGATSLACIMEVKLVDGTPKTIFKGTIFIDGSIIANTTVAAPAGQTPATMEMILALIQNLTVTTLTIQSPDKTHSRVLGEGNDGSPSDTQLS